MSYDPSTFSNTSRWLGKACNDMVREVNADRVLTSDWHKKQWGEGEGHGSSSSSKWQSHGGNRSWDKEGGSSWRNRPSGGGSEGWGSGSWSNDDKYGKW